MSRLAPTFAVICLALVASLVLMTGCVSQSEFDAKVAELKKQADNLNRAEQEAAQLQKDLGAAKDAVAKAKKEAEAKIEPLEKQIAELKTQADKLPQLDKEMAQLKTDLEAAKTAADKAAQAKTEADAKIKAMEQQGAELKKRADRVPQLEKEIEQLKTDLKAAKAEQEKK